MTAGTRARDWAEIDFYATLGVERDAPDDEIGAAYRALAKQLHPDAGATAAEVARFVEVTQAYDVLGDARLRRDYDRVRLVERTVVAAGPTPGFKPAKVHRREFTRRWAWFAVIVGVLLTIGGVLVSYATWSLHDADADERAATIPVDAVRTDVDGAPYVSFVVDGEAITVREPERKEPGGIGSVVRVRYDPQDPTRVIADEDRFPRDITLAIVALKLLVGGLVFAALGARRLLRGV